MPRLAFSFLMSALIVLPAGFSSDATAQEYPARAVKIVVPFAAGGPADIYARFMAQRLQDALGQAFVVDNRPGAGSLIGTDLVAKSPADGYTLLLMSNTHTVNESLFKEKPFQLMRDFAPISPLNYSDLVLVVKPALAVNNLRDLLNLAKQKPESLSYASSGPGTPYHMAGELFKSMAGVSILHVPYKGSSGARVDVLGGQVDMMFDAITTMSDFIRSGKVKAMGTTGKTRSAILPDIPTVSEAGVPGYEAVIWLGLLAPRNTPVTIINKLNSEITRIVSTPEVRQTWAKQGAIAMTMTPGEFSRFMNEDIAKWAQIVRVSGAKPD
ncbi:MAG: tripartite tricarboxylate transporter substrate binding protein [Rhodocyclaceae bacterium]|nr:MAG: tripartite tricarboxylate transporter substrate binding protein [Rhodocyclaceae bacterium]